MGLSELISGHPSVVNLLGADELQHHKQCMVCFRHASTLWQAQDLYDYASSVLSEETVHANEYTPLPPLVDKGAQRILSDGL